MIDSHKQLLDELDKNGWELSMYSEKESVRRSAFRNLSELGNIETIDKIDKVIKFNINNIDSEERKLLLSYRNSLKTKIKNATETTRRTIL